MLLSIEIKNNIIIDWLNTLDPNVINDKLNSCINIGYTILNESAFNNISTNIKLENKVEMLTNSLNEFTNIKNKSVSKGTLSEQIVQNALINAFPKYEIIDKTKSSHQADFEIITSTGMAINLELKNYNKNIDQIQIDKLYKDINIVYLHQRPVLLIKTFLTGVYISMV
jgi:hypothetical protein